MICSLALLLLASSTDNIAAAKSALEGGLPAVAIDKLEGSPRTAKDAGLTAVGIEREEKYCEIAAKRMGQEVMDFA